MKNLTIMLIMLFTKRLKGVLLRICSSIQFSDASPFWELCDGYRPLPRMGEITEFQITLQPTAV